MIIKKTMAAIMVACAIFMMTPMTGCQKTNDDVIRDSIVERLAPYKDLNDEVVARLSKTADDEGLSEFGISGEDFAYAILDGFDYSIDSIEVSGKDAKAEVTISSKSLSGLTEALNSAMDDFDLMGNQTTSQDLKTERIREIVLEAISGTENVDETISLNFTLNGSEWTSSNITTELGNLDSVIFSG